MNLVRYVIATNHEPIFASHPGRKRSLETLCLRYYLLGMRKDVEDYVSKCDECQRRKHRGEYTKPLGEVIQPNYRFEIVSLEICGPSYRTPRWNRFVFTFVYYFTRYAAAIPLSEITAECCARAFDTYVIARHGSGSILVTDQGRQIRSAFFKETCKILGVRQMNTTPPDPMSNGKFEKLNKTMNQGLSHYVNAAGTSWYILHPFSWWHTEPPLAARLDTAHFLLHGREMVLPSSQNFRTKLAQDVREAEYAPRLENLKSALRSAYRLVRQNNLKSHATNITYYDRRAKKRSLYVTYCTCSTLSRKEGSVANFVPLGWDCSTFVKVEQKHNESRRQRVGSSCKQATTGV